MHGDSRDTIYKTDYADDAGTEKLTNYLQHDQQTVRDRTGRPMSKKEIEQFNDKADGKRNRHIIISPRDHDELSEEELDRATRRYMRDMTEERPTADYVYSVHDDKENGRDVHIAMTANDKTDLEMYPDDIKRERNARMSTTDSLSASVNKSKNTNSSRNNSTTVDAIAEVGGFGEWWSRPSYQWPL